MLMLILILEKINQVINCINPKLNLIMIIYHFIISEFNQWQQKIKKYINHMWINSVILKK